VEAEVVPSKDRIQAMALEMIEAAKDMQEEGELETAVAMFKQVREIATLLDRLARFLKRRHLYRRSLIWTASDRS
jgi:hypothetical protein